jgi:glycosyltransferase involved in cell wall biosynthesis
MLLESLARHHDITLVALAWGPADRAALDEWRGRGLEVHIVHHPRTAQLRGLLGDPRRPLQQVASSSPAMARLVRDLITRAALQGRPYDAIHVEHIRGAVALGLPIHPGVRTIFDAVDCIADLARLTRRHNPRPSLRLLAALEEARTRRLEALLVAAADATTVVADRDRAALVAGGAPDHIAVIPNGMPVVNAPSAPADEPVAIFTGKLSYHANQAALRLLLASIWPRVRAALPQARLIVAGAEPPAWLGAHHERAGVAVIANPPEMLPLIARARVALAPMVYGVGVQNKVLEAMACGVPVVATRFGVAGLTTAAQDRFLLADTTAAFAERTVRLLTDAALARRIGLDGRDYACRFHSWERSASLFEALYAGGAPARLVTPEQHMAEVA